MHLVERERGDFGVAMARLLVLSTYLCELYDRLQRSTDETLAAIAAKAVKEVDYHRDHATMWVLRLGDGTDESHRRMQAALDQEWPYVGGAVRRVARRARAGRRRCRRRPGGAARGVRPAGRGRARRGDADPPGGRDRGTGGRRGVHTAAMAPLLEDMQGLARAHPGATW